MTKRYWIVSEVPSVAARRLCPSRRAVGALPDDPYDLAEEHLVYPCVVHTEAECAAVVESVARNVPAVVRFGTLPPPMRQRLIDDLDRVATPSAAGAAVTDDQAILLEALAAGATLAQAAAEAGVGVRTANRRLADARRALDASTNIEAVRRWRLRHASG